MCMCLCGCALFNLIFYPLAWPRECLSKTLNVGALCVFIRWGAEKGVSTPPFSEHHPFPQHKHTNTLMQIWERMNQMWEMHLHNLLTTHSHLNHYTISQVSSVNIQEPTGKIPEMFLSDGPGGRGRGRIRVGGKARSDWCQRSWTGLEKETLTHDIRAWVSPWWMTKMQIVSWEQWWVDSENVHLP